MSSLAANVAATGTRQRSPESLKYYQSAVSMLRQRLADDAQRSGDAVIITLSNLCGFEAMSGNYDAVDMHTQGIRHVVNLRGGFDSLGESHQRLIVKNETDVFQALKDSSERYQLLWARVKSLIPKDGNFAYPEHPFDPGLCNIIAKFRPGLTDLALSGGLSHQMIVLISEIDNWERDIKNSLQQSDAYDLHGLSQNSRYVTLCGEFLHQPTLTLVEQLLILGMLGFCYSTDHTRATFWLSNAFLQLHCRYLNSVVIQVTERNAEFMTWVASVLAATFDPGSQPWALAFSLLKARPSQQDWRGNVNVSENFFWNESMSLRLSSKIGYLRQKDPQGQG
ncbi:hypothetical protein LTR10_015283 [Elasticomyces elasticus]|uniref:Transcription factor domain-containing protein n=1 Tax=Exophiala sideris TaxID=1016849 RepID=A0ABR0JIZ5_9EURO|nr:hypothetical protein LTR10_015283 [Elasticomyces elasticus]KAK5035028.1 hypothetical protein LTS07_002463 [Exophiala sideris]KAK5065951.1 hypothetical protein LTR69_002468 [Exophiala sideris]